MRLFARQVKRTMKSVKAFDKKKKVLDLMPVKIVKDSLIVSFVEEISGRRYPRVPSSSFSPYISSVSNSKHGDLSSSISRIVSRPLAPALPRSGSLFASRLPARRKLGLAGGGGGFAAKGDPVI